MFRMPACRQVYTHCILCSQAYKEKLRELKRACRSLKKRVEEAEKRPKLIELLRKSINISLGFALYMRNQTGELQIFTEVEMTTLEKLVNDSMVGIGILLEHFRLYHRICSKTVYLPACSFKLAPRVYYRHLVAAMFTNVSCWAV